MCITRKNAALTIGSFVAAAVKRCMYRFMARMDSVRCPTTPSNV